jgi:hypothetical protein
MILSDVKALINTNKYSDNIIEIYIRRAVVFIKNYLNNNEITSDYIEENYADAIILLVYNALSVKGDENIQSKSQGQRSVTYKTSTNDSFNITNDIKALLPLPRLKFL